jgi:pimeloyl-ACP methyl ester carboxylesterase
LVACGPAARPLPIEPIARETGFATLADGGRIYYEAAGSGPGILFIHGLGGNHAVWYHQMPSFARAHRAVAFSQRGFAPSSSSRHPFDIKTLVKDAVAVLEAAAADDVVVVGQSMGGWTALALALARPDLIKGVVLADTIAGIFDPEIERHYDSVAERARALGSKPPPLGRHPAISPRFSDEHPDEAYLYQLLATFGAPRPADVTDGLRRARFSDDDLRRLVVPVLFLVGAADPIFPPDIVRRAAARIPRAEVVVIDDAAHSPYFEQPGAWNDVVRRFAANVAVPN